MRCSGVAFLSSMVLELLATLGVALVAVTIGLRLVYGEMGLTAGIIALVLAPEVYLPLRALGSAFHASEDGTEAAGRAFALLESTEGPARPGFRTQVPPTGALTVELTGVAVRGRDGWAPSASPDGSARMPCQGTFAPCRRSTPAGTCRTAWP